MQQQSIEIYYRELDKSTLLTREEEEALYPSIATDTNARNKLVETNLKIALKSAKSFKRKNPKYELSELIAEANLGLSMAIERFDPSQGFRFSTYAQWWINNRLQQFDLYNHSSVPSPKRVYYKGKKFNFLKGKNTPLSEILEEMECTHEEVEKIDQITSRSYIPIDHCQEEEFIAPQNSTQDLLQKVEELLHDTSVLENKERLCLSALYGFGSQEKQSQTKLAEQLNHSTQEIRSIQHNALKKLQSILG